MADAWSRNARSLRQDSDHLTENGSHENHKDRHIRLGVNHPSDDPARHRVFEIRAYYDQEAGGWVARIGEQNLNEQIAAWGPRPNSGARIRPFPTAAACLGDAVEVIVAMVDREAVDPS